MNGARVSIIKKNDNRKNKLSAMRRAEEICKDPLTDHGMDGAG